MQLVCLSAFLYLMQELPRDKWFCCDDCNRIHMALHNSVSIGAEIVPASLSCTILRKHVDKGLLIDGMETDIQWRILSGKSRFPEHLPFLSRSAAIFRVTNKYCDTYRDLVDQSYTVLLLSTLLAHKNGANQEIGPH